MKFALIRDGAFIEVRDYPSQPEDIPHKNVVWKQFFELPQPTYNYETEILEGPVFSMDATSVTKSWTKRALTTQELDLRKDHAVEGIDKVILKVLFKHENDIRALKSQAPITQAQFLAAIKAML